MSKNRKLKVLDLFSGCGGLSFGFGMQNFEIVAGIDNWQEALITFEKNHKGAKGILVDLSNAAAVKNLIKNIGHIDVIVGGPPCQGFSISGKRNPNDPRNTLYKNFVELLKELKPAAFLMENVPNLVAMDKGKIKNKIIKDFSNMGYKVSHQILLASDYGVPQNRKRVVFVGLKNGKKFIFPTPTHSKKKITIQEAISDLSEKTTKDGTPYSIAPRSEYQERMRKESNGLYNHEETLHTEKTKSIINLVPDGGNYKDLPEKYKNTRKVNIAWTRFSSKKPSLTIDTGHNHHFHYKYNRVPTARESARIQSFPDNFIFMGKKNDQLKQIGNAVPPLLAEAIAKQLLNFLT